MANNSGTLVIAAIRPWADTDVFASAFANEIRGGLHIVANDTSRNLLLTTYSDRKEDGMLVYVLSSASNGGARTMYQLNGTTWELFNPGGVTLAYVDGSLQLRDSSISSLNSWVSNHETSLGNLTVWNQGLDTSLGNLSAWQVVQDSSLAYIRAAFIPNASLSDDFVWNNGSLEVSLGSVYGLDQFVKSSSIGYGLYWVDGKIDVSIFVSTTDTSRYTPTVADNITMPVAVGGIPKDTSAGGLRGKTYDEIWTDLLFPTVDATVGLLNSLGLSGISGTLEVGTLYGPTLTATYNSGRITNGDGTTDGSLTGAALQFVFRIPGNTVDGVYTATSNTQTHNPTDVSIALGTNTWTVNASWGAGTGTYYNNKGVPSSSLDYLRVAGSASATNTITGQNKAYWGTDPQTSFGESSDVTGLDTSALATARGRTFTIANGGGEYIWYCYPTRFGQATAFTVGGFATTFLESSLLVTNLTAVPYTENFYTYRSLNTQSGSNITVVVT